MTPDAPVVGRGAPTRRRAGIVLLVVGAAVAIFAVIVAQASPQSTSTVAPSLIVGKYAPALGGAELQGGSYSLADQRGRFVLVNFFASWCTPCRAETAAFVRFLSASASQPWAGRVGMVGVTVNDRESTAAAFMRQTGANWPVVYDASGVIGLAWGVANPPQTFLVAPNGTVLTRVVGQVNVSGLDSLMALAWRRYG